MSSFLHASGISPNNESEALGIAMLYLSLSFYHGMDPRPFLLSSVDDVPKPSAPLPGETIEDVRKIVQPTRMRLIGKEYEIEFFMTDLDWPRIHRWQMKVGPDGLRDVSDRIVYPLYKARQELYDRAANSQPPGKPHKMEFQLLLMGDGGTDDGGTTDLQQWAASNGPGVSRTHIYYNSHEAAERHFQKELRDAVVVMEEGNWLDSSGKIEGKKALLLLPYPDGSGLYALQLFEDSSSVLEFSCSCLSTLTATGN